MPDLANIKTVKLPVVQNIPFTYELVVNGVPEGQQITSVAYIDVYDGLGKYKFARWTATVSGNKFVWYVPASQLNFLEHGAIYSLYMEKVGESDRQIIQTGKFYWSTGK